ncbi:hypothetical protein [Pseudomonas iranensis]|nr:hypothetical protein [Pseudomonas iranensis]
MKIMFWCLAAGLLVVMAAYSAAQYSSGVCQMPRSTSYNVFR